MKSKRDNPHFVLCLPSVGKQCYVCLLFNDFLLHFSVVMIVSGAYSNRRRIDTDRRRIAGRTGSCRCHGARSCCCVCCMCLCYLFVSIVRFQGDVNLRAAMFVSECYVFVGLSVCMRVVAFARVCWFERVHACCCVVVLLCCCVCCVVVC